MSDNSFDRLIALLAGTDVWSVTSQGLETARKTVDSLIDTAETFAATIDNLNKTATRINDLLDEIEQPLKRVLAQFGTGLGALATVGDGVAALGEIARQINPLVGRPVAGGNDA